MYIVNDDVIHAVESFRLLVEVAEIGFRVSTICSRAFTAQRIIANRPRVPANYHCPDCVRLQGLA